MRVCARLYPLHSRVLDTIADIAGVDLRPASPRHSLFGWKALVGHDRPQFHIPSGSVRLLCLLSARSSPRVCLRLCAVHRAARCVSACPGTKRERNPPRMYNIRRACMNRAAAVRHICPYHSISYHRFVCVCVCYVQWFLESECVGRRPKLATRTGARSRGSSRIYAYLMSEKCPVGRSK